MLDERQAMIERQALSRTNDLVAIAGETPVATIKSTRGTSVEVAWTRGIFTPDQLRLAA